MEFKWCVVIGDSATAGGAEQDKEVRGVRETETDKRYRLHDYITNHYNSIGREDFKSGEWLSVKSSNRSEEADAGRRRRAETKMNKKI